MNEEESGENERKGERGEKRGEERVARKPGSALSAEKAGGGVRVEAMAICPSSFSYK